MGHLYHGELLVITKRYMILLHDDILCIHLVSPTCSTQQPDLGKKIGTSGDVNIMAGMWGHLPKSQSINISGWWFGTWILFSISYGMSSFPLTNSYFSRWLKPPTRYSLWFLLTVGPWQSSGRWVETLFRLAIFSGMFIYQRVYPLVMSK